MRIATYNVNGITARLPRLLEWLDGFRPDIVCLQELKAPQERFPQEAVRDLGYSAIWHGQKSWNGVAILSRGETPRERTRALPGDPEDLHSRYIEAEVGELVIGGLYLPNGNPAPGPKFDYKLRWFERLRTHAQELLGEKRPVILAGDFNVMPTDLDVYAPERWREDALFRPEVRQAYAGLVAQGWTDALRELHPGERIYTFWDYFRNAFGRDAGLRIDHLLLSPELRSRLPRRRRGSSGPRARETKRPCTHLGGDRLRPEILGRSAAARGSETQVRHAEAARIAIGSFSLLIPDGIKRAVMPPSPRTAL